MSIQKNTLINLAGTIVPIMVMLITVPMYLNALGEVRYGVLALVWLVLGYFSVLEMGLGKATANQIAKAHATSIKERSEIFWTALLSNALLGVLAALLLWLAGGYLLTNILKMPEGFRQEAIQALPWMISTLPLAMVSSVLIGALEGRNEFFFVNMLQVISNTIFQVIPLIVAFRIGPGLEIIIPTAVISRAAMNLPFFVYCYRLIPLSLTPNFSFKRSKSLFSYGGWVAITATASPIMETFDRFLIGIILGAKAVAHYTIAYQLATKIRILPASLLRALFPRFSAYRIEAEELALKSFAVLSAIMTTVIVLAELLVEPFLVLWVGEDIARETVPIAQIILVGIWANSLAYIPLGLLQGCGKPGLVAKLQLLEIVPFLLVLYFATREWGLIGAATAWSIRVVLDSVLMYLAAGILGKVIDRVWMPFVFVMAGMVISFFAPSKDWHIFGGVGLLICLAIWVKNTLLIQILISRISGNSGTNKTHKLGS